MHHLTRRNIVIGSAAVGASLVSGYARAEQLSADQFIGLVKAWRASKTRELNTCWTTKGGWEGWAQCDLAIMLLFQNSTYEVEREMTSVYAGRDRPDFVINNSKSGHQRIIVELKCESFNNIDNFVKGLNDDVAQLAQKNLVGDYKNATRLSLGLFTTPAKLPDYTIYPGSSTRGETKQNSTVQDFYMCWRFATA
ncbi:hypothetical protein ABIB82_001905 [Bradyrhizobium sp. i1.8.4]|uniref:hypothetical protein n=1 Tax=unclassified Bradyrhizobium TaxID=2631580 RepID=UPI003D1BFC38